LDAEDTVLRNIVDELDEIVFATDTAGRWTFFEAGTQEFRMRRRGTTGLRRHAAGEFNEAPPLPPGRTGSLFRPEDLEPAASAPPNSMTSDWFSSVEIAVMRHDDSSFQAGISASLVREPDGKPCYILRCAPWGWKLYANAAPELWRNLVPSFPEMRLLFISGCAAEELSPAAPFLKKPFAPGARAARCERRSIARVPERHRLLS